MNSNNQKAYIFFIIEVIQKDKKTNIRKVAKIYDISNTILQYRINNITFHFKYRFKSYNLLESKKNIISKYIININSKDFFI